MTRTELENKLLTNVIDLRFVRRRPVAGKAPTRRILCTKSGDLLNSVNGRIALNYRAPSSPPDYDVKGKNLVTVWDIFMQDYRNISVEGVQVLNIIPANDEFWKYFNENLRSMTAANKLAFMGS